MTILPQSWVTGSLLGLFEDCGYASRQKWQEAIFLPFDGKCWHDFRPFGTNWQVTA